MNSAFESNQVNNKYIMNLISHSIAKCLIKNQNFCGNQLDSYNYFIKSKNGLRRIIENMFKIENLIAVTSTEPIYIEKDKQKYQVLCFGLNIVFKNVEIERRNQKSDQIVYNDENGKHTINAEDITLPINAARLAQTLKLDVKADIHVKLYAYDNREGQGDPIDEKIEILEGKTITQIPLMVGSVYCSTYGKTKQQLIKMGEDPVDKGGDFVIKGIKWTADFVESIKYNELSIARIHKDKLLKGLIMSKPGDAFETSITVHIVYHEKSGKITILLHHERFKFLQIPFFAIFKLFGITDETEMMEMIIQDDIKSNNEISKQLQKYILRAVNNEYELFENAAQLVDEQTVLEHLNKLVSMDSIIKKSPQDMYIVYNPQRIKSLFVTYFLPHMGTTCASSNEKMRYLGHLMKRLLLAHKSKENLDYNTYLNKRIHSTGQNMAKTFKTQFNFQFITPIKRAFISEIIKQQDIRKIDSNLLLSSILENNYNNKAMQKAIITGQGVEMKSSKGQSIKGKMQSQRLNSKNMLCVVSQKRVINNSKQTKDKQSKRILEERAIRPEFVPFVCVVQAVESSENAGKIKSLASMAKITDAIPSKKTIQMLKELLKEELIELWQVPSKNISKYGALKVFVNGYWIGFIQKCHQYSCREKIIQKRRQNPHKWGTLTVYISQQNELRIYSDYGRIIAPMIIVHRDKDGNPYLNITEKHASQIVQGNISIDWLLENQVIEYLSIEETQNCLVAENIMAFVDKIDARKEKSIYKMSQQEVYSYFVNNPIVREDSNIMTEYKYTHCLIPESMFGPVALTAPFCNHSQTQRLTMYTNHARQACGWAAFNFDHRTDQQLFIQQEISQPSVRTIMNDSFTPNGQQIMVAYMCYNGVNQEDAVIINRGSIERGLFKVAYYTYEDVQIRYNEFIDEITHTQPDNYYGNCLKLVDGIIQEGVWVYSGDVLVAKKEQTKTKFKHNTSLIYQKQEPSYVEEVIKYEDEQKIYTIKIKLKIIRDLKEGDKLSSRAGCKSIVCQILDTHAMPFTEEGIVPDLILNPNSIITRMCTGQILESVASLLCIKAGDIFDGTTFCEVNVDDIIDKLQAYGVEDLGYRYMNNGDTGDQMIAKVFMAPTFYQRLQKFAVDQKYSIYECAKDPVTRQAIDGGSQQDGGIKIGEMEKDCLFAQGCMAILNEKMFTHSDGVEMIICKNCGNRAEYNNTQLKMPVYSCSVCGAFVDLTTIEAGHINHIVMHSLESMGMSMQLHTENIRFYQKQ